VTDLPPLKESHLEIPVLRAEEVRELIPDGIFSLPGGFLFRMITPLDLKKSDLPSAGNSHRFLQDSERSPFIG
jgi:hypothetical protein